MKTPHPTQRKIWPFALLDAALLLHGYWLHLLSTPFLLWTLLFTDDPSNPYVASQFVIYLFLAMLLLNFVSTYFVVRFLRTGRIGLSILCSLLPSIFSPFTYFLLVG